MHPCIHPSIVLIILPHQFQPGFVVSHRVRPSREHQNPCLSSCPEWNGIFAIFSVRIPDSPGDKRSQEKKGLEFCNGIICHLLFKRLKGGKLNFGASISYAKFQVSRMNHYDREATMFGATKKVTWLHHPIYQAFCVWCFSRVWKYKLWKKRTHLDHLVLKLDFFHFLFNPKISKWMMWIWGNDQPINDYFWIYAQFTPYTKRMIYNIIQYHVSNCTENLGKPSYFQKSRNI